MPEEMTRRLLSVKETCYYLHLSRATLYHMIERKEIAPVNIGGRTLFDRKDLDDLIEKAKAPGEKPAKKKGMMGRVLTQTEPPTGHKKSTGPMRRVREKQNKGGEKR